MEIKPSPTPKDQTTKKIDPEMVAAALGAVHVPGQRPPAHPWMSKEPEGQKTNWPEIHRLLHLLWGKAHDNSDYDKTEWNLLQRLLEEAEAVDPNK